MRQVAMTHLVLFIRIRFDIPHTPSSYLICMGTLLEFALLISVILPLTLKYATVLAWEVLVALTAVGVTTTMRMVIYSMAAAFLWLFAAA